ncbi:MAG: PPK2 family polyphosphate kinase [Sphingobacterium sp.]
MAKIELSKISADPPNSLEKKQVKKETKALQKELDELQNKLYAEHKHSVLIVLQGMDAAGKDGAIRKVFEGVNPQGINVHSFKVPTEQEADHDFLWRIHQQTPAKGMIKIFNRSHYEDVLVTRVHGLIDDKTAHQRMQAINDFENLLVQNNTHILKFYLHITPEEQKERLQERLEIPRKMWKYNSKDFEEARSWYTYRKYYEDCFEHCKVVPWTIVPANKNWYKEFIITKAVNELLTSLKSKYPILKPVTKK